jgi:uncharacterized membrane protein YgcG
LRIALVALALIALVAPARASDLPARPAGAWVVDGAGILGTEQAALEGLAADLGRKTGTRLVVVTVAHATRPPETIAIDALNGWRAGKRSACLLVVMDPRNLYVHPGDAVKGAIDSATCTAICAGVMAPLMREGKPAAAVRAGLEAIASRLGGVPQPIDLPVESPEPAIANPAPPPPPQMPPAPPVPQSPPSLGEEVAVGAIGVVAMLASIACFGAPVALIAGIIFLVIRASRVPCPSCGVKQFAKRNETTVEATPTSNGTRTAFYACVCGHAWDVATSYAWVDPSTTSDSSSSSSSSSYDSGGGGSDSSASSGGGGGSSW